MYLGNIWSCHFEAECEFKSKRKMCKKQSVSGVLILEMIVPIDADLGVYAGLAKESSVEIHRESPATEMCQGR